MIRPISIHNSYINPVLKLWLGRGDSTVLPDYCISVWSPANDIIVYTDYKNGTQNNLRLTQNGPNQNHYFDNPKLRYTELLYIIVQYPASEGV